MQIKKRPVFLIILIFLFLNLLSPFLQAQDNTIPQMFRPSELLPDFNDSYGVVFRDLNGDESEDIYVVRFRNLNRLFINRRNNTPFIDMTIHSGLGGNLMPRGIRNLELGTSSADFNNDGLTDIIIAGWGLSTRIFQQAKDFHFLDITDRSEFNLPLDGNGAFWADVNLDGNIDLFITDEHYPNRLFLGDGRGYFHDVSKAWELEENSVSQGAAFSDIDGDGLQDLYVCNWFVPDILYRNSGKQSFIRVYPHIKHLSDSLNSNGVTFGDIDNDGDPDMLVTDRNGQSALYRNDVDLDDSTWVFTDMTDRANLHIPFPAYGSVIADLNNDGWQDIWISCVGPNMWFQNTGNGVFQKKFQEEHPFIDFKRYYSTGAAVADFDSDGDLDLFVSNKDTTSALYVNPLNNKKFIRIEVIGVSSNRDAIGARIWLTSMENGEEKIIGFREVSGGGGYLSQNSLVAHFGVNDKVSYQAKIKWPSGVSKELNGLTAGNYYKVYEHGGLLKLIYYSYNFIYLAVHQPDFGVNLALFCLLIALITGYSMAITRRYQWAIYHLIIYFSLTIVLLYGINLGFQESPPYIRFLIQILAIGAVMIFLTFFMEKIRRLEISRSSHRRLLRNFSQDLIFIKNNQELFRKLVETIYHSIHPKYCIMYELRGETLKKSVKMGNYHSPSQVLFTEDLKNHFFKEEIDQAHLEIKDVGENIFPIMRESEFYGLLVIGPPTSSPNFRPEDFAIFRTLAVQTAIAIANNNFIEQTKELIQQVTEAKTRDKYLKELEKANQKLEKSNLELHKLYKDLQDTQSQLVQSEKMASLGQLVAGIAHELNNPISYIYANMKELENYGIAINRIMKILAKEQDLNQLQEKLSYTLRSLHKEFDLNFIQEDIQSLIRESLEGSRRVKEVVQNLRNFSRLDEAAFKTVDLHEGLESTLLLLNNEIKNRITVHKEYGDLPQIYCNAGNINQVFMNILLNAVQAIKENGNIWIKTHSVRNAAEIEIRDDGRGIPHKFQSKIFDPFFTTKPVGKGTGLGLSISYNIIQKHGGTIKVNSKEGKGTTFIISLPLNIMQQSNKKILRKRGK